MQLQAFQKSWEPGLNSFVNFILKADQTTEQKQMLYVYIGCALAIAILMNLPRFLEFHFYGNDQFVTFYAYYNFLAIPILLQVIPNIIIFFYGFKILQAIRLPSGEDQGIHK